MSVIVEPGRTFVDNSGRVLNAGTATFYEAGSVVTLKAIYPTAADQAALTNALSNPYTLNSGGRLDTQVHGDGPYRMIVKTSAGATILDEDNIVTTDYSALTQSVVGSILYPQTAAELASSVTPTLYYYPPGDIRRYGADMTGVSDSYAAVNKALLQSYQSTGEAVFIPAGTAYCASSGIVVDNAIAPVIYGVGQHSILKFNAASTGIPVLVQRSGLTECKGFAIYDLTIDANGGGQLSGGILQLNGCTDFLVSHINIINATKMSGTNGVDGIACSNGGGSVEPNGTIEHCHVDGVAKGAIYAASGTNGLRIISNHITNSVGAGTNNGVGILIDDCSNVQAIGNTIVGTEAQGILVTDTSGAVSDVIIQGNTITSCGSISTTAGNGDGIHVSSIGTGMTRINISNNIVMTSGTSTNGGSGIECFTVNDLIVANNIIRNSAYDGIRIQACTHFAVNGNRTTANNRAVISFAGGIQLLGACNQLVITGNECSDSDAGVPQSYGFILGTGGSLNECKIEANHFEGNKSYGNPVLLQGNLQTGYMRWRVKNLTPNVTALDVASVPLSNGTSATMRIEAVAVKSGSTDRALYCQQGLAYAAGGAATQQGAANGFAVYTPIESDGTWTGLYVNVTSNTIRGQLVGLAATNIYWTCIVEVNAQNG